MGIALKQLSYTYQEGTPFEGAALFDVNMESQAVLIQL